MKGKFLLLWIALLGLAAFAGGQVPGLPSWGAFAGGKIDSIDLANLQVRFTVPMFHKKGVGLDLDVPLVLDNTNWTEGMNYPQAWTPYGLRLVPPGVGGFVTADTYVNWCTDQDFNEWSYTIYSNYVYVDPSGVIHPLVNASNGESLYTQDWDPCDEGGWPDQANGLASDGSGYTATVSDGALVSAASAAGVAYTPTSATDRNGNKIQTATSYSGGLQTTTYFDTLNAAVPALAEVSDSSAHTIAYQYTDPQGNTSQYTEKLQQYTLQTHFQCSSIGEYSQSAYLPYELDLPDGTKYTIQYETTPTFGAGYTTGRVSQITLPTGGSITYAYTVGSGGTCGKLTQIVRTVHHGTAADQTTYTISGSQTTVTGPAPDGNRTVDTFNGTLLTQKQVYQGASTLLETEQFCYNGTVANCTGTAFGTIDDEVEMPIPGGGTINRHTVRTMSATAGAPSEVQESDWSTSGEGGNWLRQTVTQFETTYPGLPAAVTVNEGGGAQASKTAYYRDTHGNPTSIAYSYSTTNALSRTFTYNANGTVATATDVNGSATSFTYGACNGAFPTEVDEPTITIPLKKYMTWNCTGGVMLTATDENGATATWTYNDPNYWRPTQVQDVNGNVTQLAYGTDASQWSVTSTMTFNAGSSVAENRTRFDELGRPVLTQHKQGPGASGNWDSVETRYDAEGRANEVSMPYSAAAGGLNGGVWTTTTFDALGRPLTVVDGGNGKTSYTYSGNGVTVTHGDTGTGQSFSRKLVYDGVGRLASVCEITNASGSGACGTGGPTGYWTEYNHNARGQITAVWENAQVSAYQYRGFTYDELGRILTEETPESGTTTFSYDFATSNCPAHAGDLVQREDAADNITCYAHDALHRLTEVSYPVVVSPFAAAPARYFVYDSASVSGFGAGNAAGRLAEAYTGSGKTTDDLFSYDALGNVTGADQDGYISTESYYANGVPDRLVLPGTNMPVVTYSVDGEGRPTLVSASAGQNPVTAAAYGDAAVPGAPTSVTLGSGNVDTYTYDDNTGRVRTYAFAAGSATDQGTLTWNANGTLNQLSIADGIASTTDSQTCAYGYDDLARLTSTSCGSNWSQTFNYDPFGNISAGPGGSLSFGASYIPGSGVTNNRIVTDLSVPGNYDPDGNLRNDPVVSSTNVNVFDPEGHPTTLEGATVTYDALGRAVQANGNEILYAPDGGKIALMSGQTAVKAYIPLPGGGAAVYASGALASYMHADWQGSARLETNTSGGLVGAAAYSPYGYVYNKVGTFEASFTGQRQDIEAATSGGQYSFLMRDQNPTQGRWWTPDPSGLAAVDPANPQSWNAYAYVNGRPLTSTDPLGLDDGGGTISTYNCGDNDSLCLPSPPPFCSQWICDPDFQQVFCFEYGVCDPWGANPAGPTDSGIGPVTSKAAGDPVSMVKLSPQAQECEAKIESAIDEQFKTVAVFLGPTVGPGVDPMGYRNGAYNFNFFAPIPDPLAGSTDRTGRFPDSTLHVPRPGGEDPTVSYWGHGWFRGRPGSFFTAHMDSANPLDDLFGLFQHIFEDVLLRTPHGC